MTERGRPTLRKIEGGGDVVALLEELTAQARAGELVAVAVATINSEGMQNVGWAYPDDMPFAFARIFTAAADLPFRLQHEGL